MRILLISIFILSIYILGSCSSLKLQATDFISPQVLEDGITPRVQTSGLKPDEITDLFYLGPVSSISLIENGSTQVLSDTLSSNSNHLLERIVSDYKYKLSISGEADVHEKETISKLASETEHLCRIADDLRNISDIKLTPVIDSLLKSSHKRFGLITFAEGYTLTPSNYKDQINSWRSNQIAHAVIGIAANVATKGIVQPTGGSRKPIKAFSVLYAMIVDAEHKKVVYFRKNMRACEPADPDLLADRFKKIFEGFYF